ncbi:hypothetical protein [Janibacter indicus]|nr:hypothetical protein [Janibacter indicus]
MSDTHAAPRGPFEPSPVPSDRDLLPGELPFTAWGQHANGTLDLRVFDQGIWWVDAQQRPHRIAEMSLEYLRNVLADLEEAAERLHLAIVRKEVLEDMAALLSGRIPGNTVAEAFGATAVADVSPAVWLASTPLVRAVHAALAQGIVGD